MHYYSKEEEKWLLENASKYKYDELAEKFNYEFNLCQTKNMISNKLIKLGYRKFTTIRFTKEEDEWLINNFPLLGRKKTTELFNKRFNKNKREEDIKAHCNNVLNIRVSDQTYKENLIKAHKRNEMNSQYYDKNKNIIFVKAYEDRQRRNFIPRAKKIYMDYYGLKNIPSGYSVIHLDGNTLNDDIKNLKMVRTNVQRTLCRNNWTRNGNKDFMLAAVAWCELNEELKRSI